MKKILVLPIEGIIAPYVMEGFANGFLDLGFEVIQLRKPFAAYLELIRFIRDLSPDLVLTYANRGIRNNNSDERNVFYHFERLGIPVVCLFYDHPLFVLTELDINHIKKNPDIYKIYVWDTYYIHLLKLLGINAIHLMLALDDKKFFKKDDVTYEYDVSFVGKFSETYIDYYKDEILNTLAKDIIEEKVYSLNKSYDEIIRIKYPSYKHIENKILISALQVQSPYFRYRILSQIEHNNIHVFGMENKIIDKFILHEKVDYTTELPEVYRKTKINLNISSLQLINSINNRIFDVAGVGGFILTENKPDLYLIHPEVAKEIAYNSISELNQKIKYYLKNENERKEISQKLYEAVIKNHTYKHRAKFILDTLNDNNATKTKKNRYVDTSNSSTHEIETQFKNNIDITEILAILPDNLKTALCVGSNSEILSNYLKNQKGLEFIVGINKVDKIKKEEEISLDEVYIGDPTYINLSDKYCNYFDIIIYTDFFGCYLDPWKMIKEHKKYLKYTGYIFVSTMNMKNLYLILNLLLDRFDYSNTGLIRKDHVRFYTSSTLIEMFQSEGLKLYSYCRYYLNDELIKDMYKGNDTNPLVIDIYSEIYQDFISGKDCTQKLNRIFPLFNFTQDAVADLLTERFNFLFIYL